MRRRTLAAIALVVVLLGSVGGYSFLAGQGGQLRERWTSPTPRENLINHHGVGVGPEGRIVVAPVTEVPHTDAPITEESCSLVRLSRANGSVLWRATVPPEQCFSHALTKPAIADVDGDSELEVAVATTTHELIVFDGRSGAVEFRVPLPSYGYGQPTVANVTAEPGVEIVVSDIGGHVVVVEGDGEVAWQRNLSTAFHGTGHVSVWDSPIVGDVDGDGRPEVAVTTGAGLVVLDNSGDVEWTRSSSTPYVVGAQVDDDPALELLVAGTETVRARDGATGDVQWSRTIRASPRIDTVTDADGDGTPELYVGGVGGTVRALDAGTGETEWSTRVSSGDEVLVLAPVLGDIDGDGAPEVVAATEPGAVKVLDASDGHVLATYQRDVPVRTSPTLGDIDGDGDAEVLVRYGDGRVTALDYVV
ncbi:MAG: FG-GAP-like repeat-containing protein [Haloferacaceae archaeon]